jgi:hypothetical protein
VSSALDVQRERAAALARALVSHAPAGSIASIFSGGSLGRGEVWAAEIDGTLEIYSDIDLYVVSAEDASAGALRATARSLPPPAPPAGARFLRSADIGVYTRADLVAQPVRPGTVELDAHHLMLYGDESIPRALTGRSAAGVPAEEALYLIENRLWDFSRAATWEDNTPPARLALAQALKAQLDVYAAHAIVDGTFCATLAARAQRFHSQPPATMDENVRRLVAGAFTAARDFGAWIRRGQPGPERSRAVHALTDDGWRVLAPRVLNRNTAPAELVARRCREGAFLANARDIWRLRRRLSAPRMGTVLALALLAGRSPVDALRLDALVRCLASADAREFGAHFTYVDRLTRHLGFNQGALEERVRTMHAAVS